jgi:peptidoglycan/LPS O-acetylase OafA/YrhL
VAEFVTATLVTIAVAALSYRLFESRFLRLKDRFEPKRSAEPAAEQPRVSAAKA